MKSENDAPNVRPQRRSRARCCGASSSENGRPTNVTVSAPAGNVVWSSLTGLRNVRRRQQNEFLNQRTSCNSPRG